MTLVLVKGQQSCLSGFVMCQIGKGSIMIVCLIPGSSDMLQKMKDIREMQERLTTKHFEIDQLKMGPDSASNTGLSDDQEDRQLMELTQALEKLGSTIQSLHSKDSHKKPDATGQTKKVTVKENVGDELV